MEHEILCWHATADGKIQGPQFPYMSSQNTTEKLTEENNGLMQKTGTSNDWVFSDGG